MKDSVNPGKRGLPLGTLNSFMAVLTVLISVLLLFASYRTANGYKTMRAITDGYIKYQQSANNLLSASDYLTEQARGFVTTGRRVYLDNYFEEVNVTRRRQRALETLHDGLGGASAYQSAHTAMKQSNKLTEFEIYAMGLKLAGLELDLTDYPEAIQNLSLTSQDAALSHSEKDAVARAMMFGDEYVAKKEAVNDSMQQCIIELVTQTEKQESVAVAELDTLLATQQALIILLIVNILTVVFLTSLLVINPLLRSVQHIRSEQPIPIRGANEFRFLARTYNMMFEANREKKEKLAFEASHDKLTGLYNRAGYDFLLQNADLENAALLLIDADNFKSINDTYGHKMGDRVLVRIATVLKESFRSDDKVCRVGGDEFVTIMVHAGPEFRELIEGKITRINDTLQHPKDDLPPTSVSVGVAFGSRGVEHIAKSADAALYRVKRNGRCGCAFYE